MKDNYQNHLTKDEIKQFIELNRIVESAIPILARVNGHLYHCEYCRKKYENCKENNHKYEI